MGNSKIRWSIGTTLVLSFIVSIYSVAAAPVGLNNSVEQISSSRWDDSNEAYIIEAQAGNVTELNINTNWTTRTWQGYYGNITGRILLGNTAGNALYDWSVANPTGQVYATRINSLTWANVRCANNTEIAGEETSLGLQSTDNDGVDETFKTPSHSAFMITVGNTINANTCNSTNLYNATGQSQAGLFEEVLLSNAAGEIIYTSLLNNSANGFDNRPHDFQMIVGENGHAGDATTTTYYFWAQIN